MRIFPQKFSNFVKNIKQNITQWQQIERSR
jgi:hypothetical protein